jgi:hypothetical protein
MADEIIYSGIGDLSLAAALSAEYILLAADRNALPNHPALQYVGDISVGAHSAVIKVPHIGLMGYNLLASTGDGTSVANTALTDGSTSVTVGRYSKAYEASDLAKMTRVPAACPLRCSPWTRWCPVRSPSPALSRTSWTTSRPSLARPAWT